jgi:hypothetical protein
VRSDGLWDGKVKEPQYALFGIFQIPAAVLVGEDGTVIAFGDEVRGDKLLHLLEPAYAKGGALVNAGRQHVLVETSDLRAVLSGWPRSIPAGRLVAVPWK